MATSRTDRKIQLKMPDGTMVDGIDVAIHESLERWSEVHLEDGTILRIKPILVSVARIDGQYDQEGNPVYVIKATQAITLVDVPAPLRKKDSNNAAQ